MCLSFFHLEYKMGIKSILTEAAFNLNQSVSQINNKKVGEFLKKLSTGVDIRRVGTDGFNETGNAGFEAFFEGKEKSMVAYNQPVLGVKSLTFLSTLAHEIKSAGAEFEMGVGEDGEFFIVVAAESD